MKEFFSNYPEQEDKLYLLESESKDFSNIKLRPQHDDLIEKVTEEKIFQSFQQFEDRLNNQLKFLNNYMKMYEVCYSSLEQLTKAIGTCTCLR